MQTVITVIIIFLILVVIHELGHFFAAIILKIKVLEFGIGFPPRLFAKSMGKGKTVYSINLIPAGGFVQIKGEDSWEDMSEDSFASRSALQRAFVLISGVLMNFLLALVLFSIVLTSGVKMTAYKDNFNKFARIDNEELFISHVLPGSPAEISGIQSGDYIFKIDGFGVGTTEEMRNILNQSGNRDIVVNFKRGSDEMSASVKPYLLPNINVLGIGVELVELVEVSYPWYIAPIEAFKLSMDLVSQIPESIKIIFSVVKRGESTAGVIAGPVGIANLAQDAASQGMTELIQFVALLSLNLAIINILPIPALDGGRLFFIFLEKIFGERIIKRNWQKAAHYVGFVILIILVLAVTVGDIKNF